MTPTIVPTSPTPVNPADFASVGLPQRLQADLQKDIDIYMQMPMSIRRLKDINRGQKDLLVFLQYRCKQAGYCIRSKAIRDAAVNLSLKDETVSRYIHALVLSRKIHEVEEYGRKILIAHTSAAKTATVLGMFAARAREEQLRCDTLSEAVQSQRAGKVVDVTGIIAKALDALASATCAHAFEAHTEQNFDGAPETFADGAENFDDAPETYDDPATNPSGGDVKEIPADVKVLTPFEHDSARELRVEFDSESETLESERSKKQQQQQSEASAHATDRRAGYEDRVVVVDSFDSDFGDSGFRGEKSGIAWDGEEWEKAGEPEPTRPTQTISPDTVEELRRDGLVVTALLALPAPSAPPARSPTPPTSWPAPDPGPVPAPEVEPSGIDMVWSGALDSIDRPARAKPASAPKPGPAPSPMSATDAPDDELWDWLRVRGITRSDAAIFMAQDRARVVIWRECWAREVEWHKTHSKGDNHGGIRDEGAYIYSMLSRGANPKSYTQDMQRKEREEAAAQIAAQNLEAGKAREARIAKESTRIEAYKAGLTEEEWKSMREEALKALKPEMRASKGLVDAAIKKLVRERLGIPK